MSPTARTGSPSSMSSGPTIRSSTCNTPPTESSTTPATWSIGATNASLFAYVADGVERAQGDPAHLARDPAQFLRLLARSEARADRLAQRRARRRWRCRAASSAIAASTRPATRSPSSAASARARSTLAEMQKFYLGPDGKLFTVTDQVKTDDFVPARPNPAANRSGRAAAVGLSAEAPLRRPRAPSVASPIGEASTTRSCSIRFTVQPSIVLALAELERGGRPRSARSRRGASCPR